MRILLTIALAFLSPICTVAQDNVNRKEMVGFGCYFEGRTTKTVIKVMKLLKAKNYKRVSRLLTSGNSGEKYLAVISLQRLQEGGQYTLSKNDKDLLNKAMQSDVMVSVCEGCTYFDQVPLKNLLKNNLFGASQWLDKTIKKD